MSDIIETLLLRNLQEVSAKAILRTDAPPSQNCTLRTAPFFSP
jgi:hypothetical protein